MGPPLVVGAIPFVGWGAAAAKGAKYAYKGIDAARSVLKGVDEVAEAAGAASEATRPGATGVEGSGVVRGSEQFHP